MRILTPDEFKAKKTSDTLAIMGCGYSINDITTQQWYDIDEYNSIGMNWFCNSGRPVTFYLVREQCVTPKRLEPGSLHDDFVEKMKRFSSTKIVKDMAYRTDNYQWAQNTDLFEGEGIILPEIRGRCNAKAFRHDLFTEGCHHGKSSLYDILHIAVQMGYERLIFCGIDLYDSRYFWLGPEETREIVAREGSKWDNPHPTSGTTLSLIEDFMVAYPNIKCLIQNPKSVLSVVMGVW